MPVPDPDSAADTDTELIGRLRADLQAAAYDVDTVTGWLGPVAFRALEREQLVPALRVPAREPATVLARLWMLGATVRRADLDRALPGCGTDGAIRLGLAEAAGTGPEDPVRPLLDLRPHGSEVSSWWLASDLSEQVTGRPLEPDHVVGVGGASATLARWTPRRDVGTALDLGTGCGVQALYLSGHCPAVTATDVSARALRFAALNAALNEVPLELCEGDLLEPVAGRSFDLVVSNPPFVITPRGSQVPDYVYRDAGMPGDEVVRTLVEQVGSVLAPGGVAQLLGNWEVRAGQDWSEVVDSWLPAGLDAWVVQRESQDPAEYAETWLFDGGHRPGSPGYEQMYGAWLADFAARGVQSIGFGVVTLRRPAEAGPRLHRVEELTGTLGDPMGPAVTALLAAHDWLAGRDDPALLQERLTVAGDVTEERYGTPGAEDPAIIQLRQGGGARRIVQADTALAGCVGACGGELPLGRIVEALATLLDEDVAGLQNRLVPAVRQLVEVGVLEYPVGP